MLEIKTTEEIFQESNSKRLWVALDTTEYQKFHFYHSESDDHWEEYHLTYNDARQSNDNAAEVEVFTEEEWERFNLIKVNK